jgi:gluconolactonase
MAFTEITSGLRFPEGPIAMADGSVVLVEMFGPRITRVRPDGSQETVAEVEGGPNGAAIGPDGALYLCNNGGCFTPVDLGGLLLPGGSIRFGTSVAASSGSTSTPAR